LLTYPRVPTLLIILLVLYALIGTPLLSAGGQQEDATGGQDPIAEANRLVDEGRLNEAMLLLEESVRENPDLIEASEEVMDRIRAQRAAYNDEFERLIENLINSPEEIERTLSIIDRMEELDRFPNARVAEQVSQARIIAQLAFDRNLARTIMEEGRELIEAGRYADAVERYLSGFDLQRERFEAREYGNLFANRVDEAIAAVRLNAETFVSFSAEFREEVSALENAAQADATDPLPGLIDEYADIFSRIELREEAVAEEAAVLREQRDQVPSLFPEDPVDWHITLVHRFTAGRADVSEPEGIEGALQAARSRSRVELARAFAARVDTQLERGVAATEQRAWEEALAAFTRARTQAQAGVRLSLIGTDVGTDTAFEDAVAALPGRLEPLYVEEHLRRETAAARISLAETMAAVDEARVPPEVTEEVELLTVSKASMALRVGEIREQLAGWRQLQDASAGLGTDVVSTRAASYLSDTEAALSRREAEVVEYEIATLDRIAGLRFAAFSDRFDTGESDYENGIDLLEGVEEVVEGATDEEEAVTVTYRYPDRALDEFLAAEADLEALRAEVAAALQSYRAEAAYVRADERIQERIADTAALLAEIDELGNRIASRITSARDQIARAQQLRSEGNQLVAQTRRAINNLQVEQARELWEQARQRYFESLELQQDAAFREQSDELITTLGAEIQEARNRRIVQEVRQRIDRAETLYEQESYQDSYELLTEARDLWQQTNVQPNPEIERLLRFVNAALNLESTRTLAETEPLYPVLSSYLNLARQDFTSASQIVENRGVTDRADSLLTRAQENVDNVTAVRPYNWEARILRLRILRLQDSENFDEVFERRFEEAVDRRDEDPQEALTAFETLAAINPDYPGLQEQIVELEIELGIRPDPVTQAQIAEANRLLNQARQIAAGAGEAQRQAAISLLEEAVTLNPENRQAQILLDRLRIQSGGQATVALSSAEEQQFRRAETLFIQDNVAQAYAIVQQLLQDEQNQLYPPLLDLEERIAARLGI
jgi:hypothetical protein